jgi:hypothetical protein
LAKIDLRVRLPLHKAGVLHRYRDARDRAADRTPHGQPIKLSHDDCKDGLRHLIPRLPDQASDAGRCSIIFYLSGTCRAVPGNQKSISRARTANSLLTVVQRLTAKIHENEDEPA